MKMTKDGILFPNDSKEIVLLGKLPCFLRNGDVNDPILVAMTETAYKAIDKAKFEQNTLYKQKCEQCPFLEPND